jgi:hypothetical protein
MPLKETFTYPSFESTVCYSPRHGLRYAVAQLVEVLRYRPEDRRFDYLCGH